jgi:flagella basal body P-ring formation protein FlgA
MTRALRPWAVAALLLVASAASASLAPLTVRLRAAAVAPGARLLVGDVADVEGADLAERLRVGLLDLAELAPGAEATVTREQVAYRLLLAGLDAGRFRLEGAAAARVTRAPPPPLERQVEEAARQELLLRLPGRPEQYTIRLAGRLSLPPLPGAGESLRFQAEVQGKPAVPGRALVAVGAYADGARRAIVPVYLDVRALTPGGVTLRRVEAGEELSVENFRPVGPGGLLGQRVRRALALGQAVRPDDVEPAGTPPVLVRQRDSVQLVVRLGGLEVKARGEALQDGRAGERVRVRNTASGNVVVGKVVDRAVVEVEP